MAAIKFFLRGNKNQSTIYIKFKHGRNIDLRTATDVKIDPEHFFQEEGRIIPSRDAKIKSAINRLKKIEGDLVPYIENNRLANEMTIDVLKEIANPKKVEFVKQLIENEQKQLEKDLEKSKTSNLVDYFDLYIEKQKDRARIGEITMGSVQKIKVVRGMVAKYNKSLLIEDVGTQFKIDFEKFCANPKNNYSLNTIGRALRFIKAVAKDARATGINTDLTLDSIRSKTHSVEYTYLTFADLEAIQSVKLNKPHLDIARDWLIISCYSGQRVSDFLRFEKSMLRTEKGKLLIEFKQQKTSKQMTIPVHSKVLEVLEKRNGEFPPTMHDVKYNLYIKEVCRLAGLNEKVKASRKNPETKRNETGIFEKWEVVTSHIGRRSFATNHFGIIPTSLLISATGHSSEKMFMIYIGKTDTQKAMELADYFN